LCAVAALAAALALGACGSSETTSSTTATSAKAPSATKVALASADLVAAARLFGNSEPAVEHEVQAARAVWPFIYEGLPAHPSPRLRELLRNADAAAQAIHVSETVPHQLTNPLLEPAAAPIQSLVTFNTLVKQSWAQLRAGAELSGRPGAQRFVRENSGLYVGSIYDAHEQLGQTGRKLEDGYRELGGPNEFAGALRSQEIEQLAASYSEQNIRLFPQVAAELGA